MSLTRDYKGPRDFFVEFLGVKPVDLHMAIEELKEMGSRQGIISVQDMKETIWTVNSLLGTEEKRPPPGKLSIYRIFPVRHPGGEVECCSKVY